jgi:hypothetical protein
MLVLEDRALQAGVQVLKPVYSDWMDRRLLPSVCIHGTQKQHPLAASGQACQTAYATVHQEGACVGISKTLPLNWIQELQMLRMLNRYRHSIGGQHRFAAAVRKFLVIFSNALCCFAE